MHTIGNSSPLGATIGHGGVNFSLFSRDASGVELLLFDRPDDAKPGRVISLDPVTIRPYHYWHLFVPGVRPGQINGNRPVPSILRKECALMRPKCCSIHTVAASLCRKTTAVMLLVEKATTRRRR